MYIGFQVRKNIMMCDITHRFGQYILINRLCGSLLPLQENNLAAIVRIEGKLQSRLHQC